MDSDGHGRLPPESCFITISQNAASAANSADIVIRIHIGEAFQRFESFKEGAGIGHWVLLDVSFQRLL
jgi:hypothetical protein